MRLIKLKVKNFRGIGAGSDDTGIEVTLDEQNIIFLIGKNNVGKSSILHAYDYFFFDKASQEGDFHRKDTNLPIEIEVELAVDDSEAKQLKQMKQLELELNSNSNFVFRKVWESPGSASTQKYVGIYGCEPSLVEKTTKLTNFFQEHLPKPVWIRGMSTTEDVVKQLQDLIKQAVLDRLKEDDHYKALYANAEDAIKKLQHSIQDDKFSEELKTRLDETIQKLFPDISLSIGNQADAFDLSKLLHNYTQVQAFDKYQKVDVNLSAQGHGVQRQFILSACKECHELFSSLSKNKKGGKDFIFDSSESSGLIPKTKILLIEEPELFLHPSGVRDIQGLLYDLAENSCFQLIAATHSPIMIDLSRPHSSLVRVVKKDNSNVFTYQLRTDIHLKDGVEELRMVRGFNPHVCEAFFSDSVLLVEGATEYVISKALLEKFSHEDSCEYTKSISVTDCGGKTTIPLFQKILRQFKIPYFVLHDLDEDKNSKGTRTMNQKIWNEIELAMKEEVLAMRFIFVNNFEEAHEYWKFNNGGKPYTAWKKLQSWINGSEWNGKNAQLKYPIVDYMKRILDGNSSIVHDQAWIDAHVNSTQKVGRTSQLPIDLWV
jgi:putative ATP-dependent endonuclease of the OLD family